MYIFFTFKIFKIHWFMKQFKTCFPLSLSLLFPAHQFSSFSNGDKCQQNISRISNSIINFSNGRKLLWFNFQFIYSIVRKCGSTLKVYINMSFFYTKLFNPLSKNITTPMTTISSGIIILLNYHQRKFSN